MRSDLTQFSQPLSLGFTQVEANLKGTLFKKDASVQTRHWKSAYRVNRQHLLFLFETISNMNHPMLPLSL